MSLVWPNGTTKEPARSDGYGPRTPIHTSAGWTRPYHVGTDWIGIGSLKAIGAATVIENSWVSWAGWQVLIDLGTISGRRTWARYCHLATQSPLDIGQKIARGTTIGTEGSTGQVTGRHLHLELYRGSVNRGSGDHPGSTVNPRSFISARLVKPKPAPVKKGLTVKHYQRADKHSKIGQGRTLRPSDHIYLNTANGRAASATNIVGGVGPYSITPHVYATGEPGDAVLLTLIWQDTKAKPLKNSGHYLERLVFDKEGQIQASREFKRAVSSGYAVYVKVQAAPTNKGLCRITRLDSDAYLIK